MRSAEIFVILSEAKDPLSPWSREMFEDARKKQIFRYAQNAKAQGTSEAFRRNTN